jgi:hypothetical protein
MPLFLKILGATPPQYSPCFFSDFLLFTVVFNPQFLIFSPHYAPCFFSDFAFFTVVFNFQFLIFNFYPLNILMKKMFCPPF